MHGNRTALSVILAGILLMIAGLWRGELYFVLQKGITICLECIGLG
ncbi:MAG: hypothetical protein GX887_02965 [Firmicutes bacterium]|nr:hypothetical protein [Bacillota bacterium]